MGERGATRTERDAEHAAASSTPSTPAETSSAAPWAVANLIVEDGQLAGPGRASRSEFLDATRRDLEAMVDEELGALGTGAACPFITRYVDDYRRRPLADWQRLAQRWLPPQPQPTAEALRRGIVERARVGLRTWRERGDVPAASPDEASLPLPLLRWAEPGAGPVSPEAARLAVRLGPGEALPGDVATRFGPELGHAAADVRVHRDGAGADVAHAAEARAFSVGTHIAFGSGQYRPGTPAGDAILAHELAHATARGEGGSTREAEGAANAVARSAVKRLWLGVGPAALPPVASRRSGLELRRCDTPEPVEPTVLPPDELATRGYSLHASADAFLGQSYTVELIRPPDPPVASAEGSPVSRPFHLNSWYQKRPGETEPSRRIAVGDSHAWTLDEAGEWTFYAEFDVGPDEVGVLRQTVTVRDLDTVAVEHLDAIAPTTLTGFLVGLERRDLENTHVGLAEQRFTPDYITMTGSNPATATAMAPDLPVNQYRVHPAEGRHPARYQWLAVPSDLSQYVTENRFGQQRRVIEGREGFDLGTGETARWTIFVENDVVDIACLMYGASGERLGEAHYRQVVLGTEEVAQVRRFREYRDAVRTELAGVREGAAFVPAVHLAQEGGGATELSFFLGRAAEPSNDLVLLDLTPGVAVRRYAGADWTAVLAEFNRNNSYPEGQVTLRVPENTFGVRRQDWKVHTSGASFAQRLSTGWGWASLGLAGLGALATIVPFAQPLAPAFFLASGLLGAASAGASLYSRSQEAQPSGVGVVVDIATLAGSLIGAAGAANVLRHGPRIAAATRMGRFVLYAGFTTEAVGGVFMSVEGAMEIAGILDRPGRTEDKVAAVTRILAGMLLNGMLLAWSAHNLGETRATLRRTLRAPVMERLAPADLHALSLLDEATLQRLAGAGADEVQGIASLIREDPVRAGRLIELYGGERFLQGARGRPGTLEALSDTLAIERRATLVGIAAANITRAIDAGSAATISSQLGVEVRIDPSLTERQVRASYRLGSWVSGPELRLTVAANATVGDILLHGLGIERVRSYRVMAGGFRGFYERARAWLGGRTMPRAHEVLVELEKHAAMQEARLAALDSRMLGPELDAQLARDISELDGWIGYYRGELRALGAPEGVIAAGWGESYSQRQLEQLLDAPGSGFERYRHPTTGVAISEPGFRAGQPLDVGYDPAVARRGTFPDVYGTEGPATAPVQASMELKTVAEGDSVATHFRQTRVADAILMQHGGRIEHLPVGTRSYLVVDIRQAHQTIPQALSDLSTVLRRYHGMGDARRLWAGVRFMTGSADAPVLSGVFTIP